MKKPALVILAILAIVVLVNSVFIVDEREQVLVEQLGTVVSQKQEPGLYFKVPVVQSLIRYNDQILEIDIEPQEVIARDEKRLVVDAFVKYRINDPLQFYKSVTEYSTFEVRFGNILNQAIRDGVSQYELLEVLSEKRQVVMNGIKDMASEAAPKYGVEVVDVRIVRTNLPAPNSASIYERMKTEHEKEARQTRAEGSEEAKKITSNADRERRVTIATAKQKAEILRGEGDAAAIQIYAKTFGQDPDFYRFYRTMQSYRTVISGEDTMVLSPDSDYMRYLDNINAK